MLVEVGSEVLELLACGEHLLFPLSDALSALNKLTFVVFELDKDLLMPQAEC